MPKIVLASASPRRQQLLKQIGLNFEVKPSNINENNFLDLPPDTRVESLALAKARAVAEFLDGIEDALVIGADTIVICQGEVFGKPSTKAEAVKMLSFLSGRTHKVCTGVALKKASTSLEKVASVSTDVTFRQLNTEMIEAYVSTGEPLDKAGAYAIQGIGSLLVEKISGDYFNVVGLPLVKTAELLAEFGVKVLDKF
ncbi:MAG: nucleoside triphosphate pyrophosphatase [Clostridia bacterium]|nr:nucleoside triphosphate pyrophosphatase [Clostridia bacterium]